jgi:uncharacterized protein (TIGR03437 family)
MFFAVSSLLAFSAVSLQAHIRSLTSGGVPVVRSDAQNIQFLVNNQTAAGMMNAEGRPIITANSDPMSALQASADRWSAVTSSVIQFAPLQTTASLDSNQDGAHVMVFVDSPGLRAVVGGALAIARQVFNPATGVISDSDILFNPNIMISGTHYPFSTTLADDTFDLGSVATHEIGHTLGAAHSGVIAATMFPRTAPESNLHGTLSSDDIAFARDVYPEPNVAADFGYIEGKITRAGGAGARRVLVTAQGESNGVIVCTLTNTTDGSYRVGPLPPGDYFIAAEPVDGPMSTNDLGSLNPASFDLDLKVWVLGAPEPQSVALSGGQTVTGRDFSMPAGAPAVAINRIGKSAAASPGNFQNLGPNAIEVNHMSSFDLVMDGPGIDGTLNDNTISLLGPSLNIRPGSVVVDPFISGITLVRMTVDVGPVVGRQLSSISLFKGDELVVYSGGIVVNGGGPLPGPVFTEAGLGNGASLVGGGVAPEEIVSLFGQNLATQNTAAPEPLPNQVAGTRIDVRDSQGVTRAAKISFAGPTQINFVIPEGTALGQATLTVHTAGGSHSINVTANSTLPGIFTPNGSGTGVGFVQLWRFNNDFSALNSFEPGYQLTNGALPFVPRPLNISPLNEQPVLVVAATGLRGAQTITATIKGQPAQVLGFAAQGQFEGLDQVNILLSRQNLIGAGTVAVVLTVDGVATRPVQVAFQ